MATYDLPCASCGELMWRVERSAPEGVARCQPCRFIARGKVPPRPSSAKVRPCSRCGDPRPVGRGSRAEIVCLRCRRLAHGLGPDESVNAAKAAQARRGPCHRCGGVVPGGTKRWKFCSDECFRKTRNARGSGGVRPSSAERGYDAAHVKLRAELLPLAYGTDCALCGEVMEEGQRLHLDHTEDRTAYRGMTHGACNVLDGAKRGGERARQMRLEKGWRHGSSSGPRRRSADSAA